MTTRNLLLPLIAALLLPALGVSETNPAVQGAESFYRAHQKLKLSGLPSAKAAAQLGPHLSKGLQGLLKRAQLEQTRCIKAEPDDKGPWVEGDLFTSNFEGFTGFKVEGSANARFPIQFTYTENGQTFSWKDEVVMINEGGRWVVDDVFYRIAPGFTSGFGSSLRTSLAGPGCPLASAKR